MTTADFLIKGASLPDGKKADISISNGVIASVGSGYKGEAQTVIDGKDCVVLPGLVDLHTHLREPGREDAETVLSGSSAGVKGGFTAVSAMANTSPVADTAGVVEQVYRLGQEAGLLDVFPIGAVTEGLKGESLSEIGAMADSVARVRVFSDDGNCVSDPLVMRRALEYIKKFGGVIAQHAQDPRMTIGSQMNEGEISARLGLKGWPAVAEEAIIARDVLLADHVKSRLHICHLTTAGGVEIIRWAKARGDRCDSRSNASSPSSHR
jgi:dihydroorotase